MTSLVHELFALAGPPEKELQKNYIQVGRHLYIKSGAKVNLELLSARETEKFPVVFAMGGEGTRLHDVTKGHSSKHMIAVNGKPLSKYSFDLWSGAGFSKFCFLIDSSPASQSISSFYGDGSKFGTSIKYSIERTKLGSGGSIKEAILNGIIGNSFVLHYPDDQVFDYSNFPVDFHRIARVALESGYLVVVVCVPGALYPWGEVCDKDGEVVDFIEKPFIRKDSYIGICAISSQLLPVVKQLDTSSGIVKLERSLFKEIASRNKMFKVLLPCGYWQPVNDWHGLKNFEDLISK